MAMNPVQLQNDLDKAIKDAAASAYKKSFEISAGDSESVDTMKAKVSEAFAKELSAKLAPDLAKIMVKLIQSVTPIPVLVSSTGPVTGKITLT